MAIIKVDPKKMSKPITGPWTLADLRNHKIGAPKNGLKVFSCFHCGGGSTMGYKLAGFNVLGGIEIDPVMMRIYRKNHQPQDKFSMLMPIQDFPAIPRENLPIELFDLDILDGSPPCSSFSMSGSREDGWGIKKKFREGQAEQVLDDLFFHFIKVADILKPKVVVAENVKGLIIGKARSYVRNIFKAFDKAEYDVQLFLLNSNRMGVPQSRERVFFIARRRDLKLPKINLNFEEDPIPFSAIDEGDIGIGNLKLPPAPKRWWAVCLPGADFSSVHPKGWLFNMTKVHPDKPMKTITSSLQYHHKFERILSRTEISRGQTFPDDYDFDGVNSQYVCGMSVPPLMMQRVASEIRDQLLHKK